MCMTEKTVLKKLQALAAAEAAEKAAKEAKDAARAALLAAIDEKDYSGKNFSIKYTEYESSRIDSTALKKAFPDLAAQFTKTSTARKLTYKFD